jgi:hypothetical protein
LKLAAKFPAFIAYLTFIAVWNFASALVPQHSFLYFWIYVASVPLEGIFGLMAVRELFSLLFARYPGIRTIGRWATYSGVALSMAASLVLTKVAWAGGARGRSGLFYIEVAQRSVVFSLAVVIATILYFLSRYPLHLGRNTNVSSAFFSVLFLAESVQLLIDSLQQALYNPWVDRLAGVFAALCLSTWALLLQPDVVPESARFHVSTPHEDQLLQQLDSLNELMTRAARR